MKSFGKKNKRYLFVQLFISLMLYSCAKTSQYETKQPILDDYTVGEKWTWKYKGVTTKGEVRSNGEDTRQIVSIDSVLHMAMETDTIPVSAIVKVNESKTPRYSWPLKVGKKWVYENKWTSQDGTKGSQRQDAEVLSFKEETVGAGTFMAYTIKYTGEITNSRGYNATVEDVWLYAPQIKNFIKLTQKQGDFSYVEELITYANPNK